MSNPTPLHYYETGSENPAFNLAFEEYILLHKTKGDVLILWQNGPSVIIGNNQVTEAQINAEYIQSHQIRVVRRTTGGGAVYHDLGNLNYSFITDYHKGEDLALARFTAPVVGALRDLGLNAEASGRNDILIDGKKVSGTAQRVAGSRILHHGTLLFDSDPEVISQALYVDPEKFQAKGTKSVKSRVGRIREMLPPELKEMSIETFWAYLKEWLGMPAGIRDAETMNDPDSDAIVPELLTDAITPEQLADAELQEIRRLQETKYDTWEWNYGKSPAANFHVKKKWDGGILDVWLDLKNDRIREAAFFGDFLSRMDPAGPGGPAEALAGTAYVKEDIRKVLEPLDLEMYFGSITLEEILDTIGAV